jgi:hypothetical protein
MQITRRWSRIRTQIAQTPKPLFNCSPQPTLESHYPGGHTTAPTGLPPPLAQAAPSSPAPHAAPALPGQGSYQAGVGGPSKSCW